MGDGAGRPDVENGWTVVRPQDAPRYVIVRAILCCLISDLHTSPTFLLRRRSTACGRPNDTGRGHGYYHPSWQCGLGPMIRPHGKKSTFPHTCFNLIYITTVPHHSIYSCRTQNNSRRTSAADLRDTSVGALP